jgi:hypothetical protein
MKKIVLVGLLVLCSNIFSEDIEEYNTSNILGHNLYYGDFGDIREVVQIPGYVLTRIKPIEVYSFNDPMEALGLKEASYFEYVLIVMNIAKVRFNIEFDLVFVGAKDGSGAMLKLPVLGYKGKIILPQDLSRVYDPRNVIVSYSFNEVFMATDGRLKNSV